METAGLSVKRPTLIVVIFTILILLGGFSYKSMKYELMPKFTSPIFTVFTFYPGASPYDVENNVSKTIEDALSTLENIETIRSISQESVSMIIVELKFGADLDFLLQEAQRKVNALKGELPENTRDPIVTKYALDDFPIMNIGVNAELVPTELFDVVKYNLKPRLSGIKGVGEVTLIGGTEREIQVNVFPEELEAYDLSILQIVQTIQLAGIEFPAGKLKQNQREMTIRLSSKYKNLEDLNQLVIQSLPDGSTIKLTDVAEVYDAQKENKNLYRINGVPSIGMSIKKQADANAVEVSEAVKKEISVLEKSFEYCNLRFTIADDTTDFTRKAADDVMNDLVNAVILVTLVILLFLHSFRNAFIVMFAVPVSLISSFPGMLIFDFTLNIMTLLALSLVIGILVDDAIVVIENIHRHLEMGKKPIQATLDGVKEISVTVVSTTLVLVVVFLPVALVPSIIGPILKPFSIVIVFSTLMSLLVAFTIVPLLSSRYSKLETTNQPVIINWFEKQIKRFGDQIQKLLIWSLRRKVVVAFITTVLFILSVALVPMGFIGSEFLNPGDMNKFILQIELPKDATLQQTYRVVQEVERYLTSKPAVTEIFANIGSNNEFLSIQGGANKAEVNVKLKNRNERDVSSDVYASQIKNELNQLIPGVKFRTAIVSIVGGSDVSPIQVVIESTNSDSLILYAQKVKEIIGKVPGTTDVLMSFDTGNPELVVTINKEQMAKLGLTMAVVGPTIQTAFQGNTDSKFKAGQFDYDINVRFDEFNRKNIWDVQDISFVNAYGQVIKLYQFADIRESVASSKLERYSRIPSIMVESKVLGRSAGDVGAEIKEQLAAFQFPNEVSISYEGDMKYQADAFQSLFIAFVASLLLVYLIMVALYESYIYPLIVLFSVPLSIIGALLALALTKNTLSIFSLLGIIMLIGIVLKNAILIVDFASHLKQNGTKSLRAIITATKLRLRPILMTSLSLIIGLLPLALSQGSASEWKNGLAWVIIGG
ncbi:efflux RND transporter permease subunit, partial [Draconibacterium sp.]|nr:efflux RND transporter permease subunit [Draconibacterium sp.]